jgi:hypothetical protein
MKDFKELIVWRKAHAITLAIYFRHSGFPEGGTIRAYKPTPACFGIDRS